MCCDRMSFSPLGLTIREGAPSPLQTGLTLAVTFALCSYPPSLHGSPLTDAGLALLNPALALHPALVALDLGDCMLGDEAINLICGLLPPDGAKSGEQGPC